MAMIYCSVFSISASTSFLFSLISYFFLMAALSKIQHTAMVVTMCFEAKFPGSTTDEHFTLRLFFNCSCLDLLIWEMRILAKTTSKDYHKHDLRATYRAFTLWVIIFLLVSENCLTLDQHKIIKSCGKERWDLGHRISGKERAVTTCSLYTLPVLSSTPCTSLVVSGRELDLSELTALQLFPVWAPWKKGPFSPYLYMYP